MIEHFENQYQFLSLACLVDFVLFRDTSVILALPVSVIKSVRQDNFSGYTHNQSMSVNTIILGFTVQTNYYHNSIDS